MISKDLPLFEAAGVEVGELVAPRPAGSMPSKLAPHKPRSRKPKSTKVAAAPVDAVAPELSVVPFPLHRDLRFIRRMLQQARVLCGQMGRDRAKAAFAARYEVRMEARLRSFGLSPEEARAEIARVLDAMNVLALQQRAEHQIGGSAA